MNDLWGRGRLRRIFRCRLKIRVPPLAATAKLFSAATAAAKLAATWLLIVTTLTFPIVVVPSGGSRIHGHRRAGTRTDGFGAGNGDWRGHRRDFPNGGNLGRGRD